MNKVLFIIPSYNTNRPQAVRFRNIIPHLKVKFEIHILFPSEVRKSKTYEIDDITFHEIKGSLLGHFINPVYYNKYFFQNGRIVKYIRNGIRFFFRSILFPDLFVIELKQLKKEIESLQNNYEFKAIVVSCAPFTLMKLGQFIKIIAPNLKWIVDIGDPFYKNDINKYPIQKIFAKRFESKYLNYIDKFIVTNQSTLQHYINTFSNSINKKNIKLIHHGTNIRQTEQSEIKLTWNKKIIITYIGVFCKKVREPFELYKAIYEFNNINQRDILLQIYGVMPPFFRELPDKDSKNYILFKGVIPHQNVSTAYRDGDLVLLIDNAFGFQTPSKVFELIATCKPILFIYSNPESATLRTLKKYDGVIITRNNKEDILNKLNEIFSKDNFHFNTNFNLSDYTWSNISNKFYKIISE